MLHFSNLNKEQKLERRRLLDLYGTIAQYSVLIPILILQLYFLTTWIHGRLKRGGGNKEEISTGIPSSPQLKKKRTDAHLGLRFRGMWRRLIWVARDEFVVLGCKVGVGELGFGVLWTVWLLALSVARTEGDYIHVTKRLGIVAASQLPFQYLLALKSPYSPLQYLTGCSWETLNATHQTLGRITTLFFYLHTAFYLNFFVQAHVLAKRLKDKDVILGLIGIAAFTAVGTTALSMIRKWNYRLFYTTHVSLATIVLPVLYFHVRHIRIYVIETGIVYVLHIVLRFFNERKVLGHLALVPGTKDLLEITIPLSADDEGGSSNGTKKSLLQWQPGQHVYVSLSQAGMFLRPLKTRNPFTIASLPNPDKNLTLVARVLDGNTTALARSVLKQGSTRTPSSSTPLILEGPYGLPSHSESLLGYSKILFLAGGVGATFIIPLYRTLLADLSPGPGSRRRQNVEMVWALRDIVEMNWAFPNDEREKKGMQERMTVYVTRRGTDVEGVDKEMGFEVEGQGEEGVELERLLPAESSTDSQGCRIRHGRPDLGKHIDELFQRTTENESVAIVVCGPTSMAKEVRSKVDRWVGKRDVWLHNEGFGL